MIDLFVVGYGVTALKCVSGAVIELQVEVASRVNEGQIHFYTSF